MTKLWVGTQSTPGDRLVITVNSEDARRIPRRGSRSRRIVEVTDIETGTKYRVRRASCGMPGCLCALTLA